jgi:hypothetical protein
MMHANQRNNKYQFCCLWFDPTWAQTHDSNILVIPCEEILEEKAQLTRFFKMFFLNPIILFEYLFAN